MQKRIPAKPAYTSAQISNVFQEISGNSDLATLFWIGSAVEFAFHKDVDWLFFGKGILQDPFLRVIVSAQYQKKFAFGSEQEQRHVAWQIRHFHTPLEQKRGYVIPKEAYLDVLMMIIEMGERAYEVIHGPMSDQQRLEYFEVCQRMGHWMDIPDIPHCYEEYQRVRKASLQHNYCPSEHAEQLFQSYRAHFGPVRYYIVERIMALLSPPCLRQFHHFPVGRFFPLFLKFYKLVRCKYTITLLETLLIPKRYRRQAHAINIWASVA